MKLISFNIENYRSIIYTGWCKLAHDNITALIGQNESGKTSVLEALQSFFDGKIHEDVLRSDLSMPTISCSFDLEDRKIADVLDITRIPFELKDELNSSSIFVLTRNWLADRSCVLYGSTDVMEKYYLNKELAKLAKGEKTQNEINGLMAQAGNLDRELEASEQEKEDSRKSLVNSGKYLNEARKAFKKAKKPDTRLLAEKEFEIIQVEYNNAEILFKTKVGYYQSIILKTQELSEKVAICKLCNSLNNRLFDIQIDKASIKSLIEGLEQQLAISTNEKDKKNIQTRFLQLKKNHQVLETKHEELLAELAVQKEIASRVLAGQKYRHAEIEAHESINKEDRLYTLFEIGQILYGHIPVFEFFEDFSSLLPNKIDLDDILNQNTQVEGYKAAHNFLKIAGLNADFFREKNHRILKQKIENLNGEITINFQDFWSQNVGKNNKIRLNFELEHYDNTHPEKSGKPYLEFWIKDKAERLYPKQRSRGVRWFLSFYLELKAAVKSNHSSRVLLIDEPGLSLHARAQEDVLKVFEDLKTNIQIIYCTHSPHLVDVNKLYRLLAVQRADEDDDRSETLVLEPGSLYSASTDTLSPVYSLMGVKVNNQDFIAAKNNIIVEDTLTYYYFNAFCNMAGMLPMPSFIPSTGLTNIPMLTNILLGWKVGFNILFLGTNRSVDIIEELGKTVFFKNTEEPTEKIIRITSFEFPEDIFSTLDFKKYVLQKREGITDKNSNYIIDNKLSRTILASQFIAICESNNLKLKDFDEQTNENINMLVNSIKKFIF